MGKLPSDAFDCYLNLGPSRSYEAVARKYGLSKRAVVRRAVKENWKRRIEEFERQGRESAEARAFEGLSAMNDRHLKTIRMIQARAIEALKDMPLKSAMDAVRALAISIRQERLLLGLEEPQQGQELEEEIASRIAVPVPEVQGRVEGRVPGEEAGAGIVEDPEG